MTTSQPGSGSAPFEPQGPQAYGTPGTPGMPPAAPPPAPPSGRHTLAIVALVVAIVGAVFGVIEGAYIIGWILLPIAFILAIVALVQRGKPKKMATVALIIAIIGPIAAGIAFTASVSRIVGDAVKGGEVTVAPADPAAGGQTGDKPAVDGKGTRDNPYPVGTTIANDNWKVTVNSIKVDATEEVMKANEFNDKPDADHSYGLVNLTATYLGDDKGNTLELSVDYVTSSGNVIDKTTKMAVVADDLTMKEVYKDASVTGNELIYVPTGDQGVVRVRPGLLADEVFFALP